MKDEQFKKELRKEIPGLVGSLLKLYGGLFVVGWIILGLSLIHILPIYQEAVVVNRRYQLRLEDIKKGRTVLHSSPFIRSHFS